MKHLKLYESYKTIKDIDEILEFDSINHHVDSDFKLYHLIPSTVYDDVIKNGLSRDYSKQHKFEKGIYLASDLYVAAQYRFLDETRDDYYVIEILFNELDEKYMKPDDYELFDIIDDEYPELLEYFGLNSTSDNQKLLWSELSYKHSLFLCEQLLYTSNIKPDKFSKILDKEDLKRLGYE